MMENSELERCQLNTEVDVDSDLDDTSLFMAADVTVRDIRGSGSDLNNAEEDRDQEAFAIQQLVAGN